MKTAYAKPTMNVQLFVPTEYCSTCGEEHKVYKFVCDASSVWPGAGGLVYPDKNKNGKLDLEDLASPLGLYHPCSETHEAPTDDEFIRGFLNKEDRPVIIWTDGGTNVHCTKNLDMNSWTTAKS